MTKEENNLLEALETRLRHLMFLYDKKEKENQTLKQDLEECQLKFQKLQKDYSELEKCYTDLMQARIISITDGNVKDTKQRITKLVREIDRCLALLNGAE